MGIIDRVKFVLGIGKTATVDNPPAWLASYADAERWNIPDPSIYGNQARYYQTSTWIAEAIQFTAQAAAVVPFEVHELSGEDETDVSNHPFEVLLNKPNPLQSRFEFLESWFIYRLLTGNGYIWLNRTSETQPPAEMWTIPSDRITPVPDDKMFIKGYLFDTGMGEQIPLEPWEVCHLKRFNPFSMYVGMSPIEAVATSAQMDIERVKHEAKLYGKDNGRLPGILAFADSPNDADWARMIRDIDDKANKMKAYMMLRGVKAGGVQYIQTAMSAADAQYLESRTFTKEEIFGLFAPGLASMLAINATEANSKSGKATFAEYGLWPLLDSAAQKISNDILTAYGDNLKGEFEEIRVKDAVLELQEQQEYAKTHTLAEIRQKYYEDDPLGDDRDNLLPVQINAQVGTGQPAPIVPQAAPPAAPVDNTPPADVNATNAMETDPVDETGAELKRWERKAIKALKAGKPAAVEFESEVIPENVRTLINANLENCATVEDVKAAFVLDAEVKAVNPFLVLAEELRKARLLVENEKSQKYNDNHDELGRFSASDGGISSNNSSVNKDSYGDKVANSKHAQDNASVIPGERKMPWQMKKDEYEKLPIVYRGVNDKSVTSGHVFVSNDNNIAATHGDVKELKILGGSKLYPDPEIEGERGKSLSGIESLNYGSAIVKYEDTIPNIKYEYWKH